MPFSVPLGVKRIKNYSSGLKWVWLLLLLSGLAACVQTTVKPPADVLSPPAMTKVLIDLHIAEAKALQTRSPGDTVAVVYEILRKSVLERNHTDTATFYRSFSWYATHTNEFDKIYEDIVDSLGVREVKTDWH